MNKEDFDVEYYFSIIEKFHNVAIDFEMIGDKFFQMQEIATNISESQMEEIENHPSYQRCEKRLETISNIIKKIK